MVSMHLKIPVFCMFLCIYICILVKSSFMIPSSRLKSCQKRDRRRQDNNALQNSTGGVESKFKWREHSAHSFDPIRSVFVGSEKPGMELGRAFQGEISVHYVHHISACVLYSVHIPLHNGAFCTYQSVCLRAGPLPEAEMNQAELSAL